MHNYIFTDKPDSFACATFGWQSSDLALLGVKEGYKNAADDLVKIALKEGVKNNIRVLDTYIFPIMFLYRQSLEVSLKSIYYRYYGEIPSGKHDLIKLWDIVYKKIVIQNIQNNDFLAQIKRHKEKFIHWSTDGINFSKIREVLIEIQQTDKESDVWRYFIDRKGQPYFKETAFIRYDNLREIMNDLYETFDYLYDVISEYFSS
jgi:hypothetical protein